MLEKTELNTGTETEWGLKLWNAWQNFSMEQRWRSLRGGGNSHSYAITLPHEKSKQKSTACYYVYFREWTPKFSWLRILFSSSSSFFLLSVLEYWGKVQWPLSQATSWFSSGGREEWEECIDVWRQTTALCALKRPDTRRNEPWDNQADCEKRSYNAHLHYVM